MPDSQPSPALPGKEALDKAAEFIKYTVALSAGVLVFGTGLVAEKVTLNPWSKGLLVASWALVSVSVVGGVLAYSRLPVMLAKQIYDIEDPWFTIPGKIHQICFVLGVGCLGVALVIILLAK